VVISSRCAETRLSQTAPCHPRAISPGARWSHQAAQDNPSTPDPVHTRAVSTTSKLAMWGRGAVRSTDQMRTNALTGHASGARRETHCSPPLAVRPGRYGPQCSAPCAAGLGPPAPRPARSADVGGPAATWPGGHAGACPGRRGAGATTLAWAGLIFRHPGRAHDHHVGRSPEPARSPVDLPAWWSYPRPPRLKIDFLASLLSPDKHQPLSSPTETRGVPPFGDRGVTARGPCG